MGRWRRAGASGAVIFRVDRSRVGVDSLPDVEVTVAVAFGDFEAVAEFDQGELVWVMGLGMQGDAVYKMKGFDLRPLLRAQWAQHTGPVYDIGDDLGRLEAGLESRFPLGFYIFGQSANLGLFAKYYSYMTELRLVTPDGVPIDFTNQWEFGATLGTKTPLRLWGIKLPRIGVSYRFGENVGAVRLILGKPM